MAKKNGDPEYSNLVPPFGTISFTMNFKSLYKHYYDQLTYICFRLLIFDGLPDTIEETYLKYCIFNLNIDPYVLVSNQGHLPLSHPILGLSY